MNICKMSLRYYGTQRSVHRKVAGSHTCSDSHIFAQICHVGSRNRNGHQCYCKVHQTGRGHKYMADTVHSLNLWNHTLKMKQNIYIMYLIIFLVFIFYFFISKVFFILKPMFHYYIRITSIYSYGNKNTNCNVIYWFSNLVVIKCIWVKLHNIYWSANSQRALIYVQLKSFLSLHLQR